MDNNIDLLKSELKDVLIKLLEYVSSKSFTQSEEEVANVADYVETKTGFYDKIDELKKQITALNQANEEIVDQQCKDLMHKILSFEEEHKKVFAEISKSLMSNINNLKNQQKFHTAYHTAAFDLRGDRFDAKQ